MPPTRPFRRIDEVRKADAVRELTVHVEVANNIVIDVGTARVRKIEGSVRDEHLLEVRGTKA